ncbi:MAG: helix-turn-helix transcriptional regulator [Chloroflexi bacterium]|nr:helix-turn-helix transcriptional regulator [Chloroflexota bacterium]
MVRMPLTTEHALLGFLRQQPMYGYEIHQQLSESAGLGLVWRLKQSQLYALLGKLEQEGYIVATLEAQDARPPRKVYHLTDAGHRAFLEWVQTPVPHGRELRLDFLAKFYFARREGSAVALKLIAGQRAASASWLEVQQAQAVAMQESHPYEWLVCRFRIGQIQAILDWLDTCEQLLPETAPVS